MNDEETRMVAGTDFGRHGDDVTVLVQSVGGKYYKLMEEWEEENPTGTRVLRKLARNSRRKRTHDEY